MSVSSNPLFLGGGLYFFNLYFLHLPLPQPFAFSPSEYVYFDVFSDDGGRAELPFFLCLLAKPLLFYSFLYVTYFCCSNSPSIILSFRNHPPIFKLKK